MQDVDAFIRDLERELREKELSLLDCEFLQAIESREATREQIAEWAKVFYAATRHGRLTIGNFYANAPDDPELRRELAENIFEEETGGISRVGRCHMDVFQDLLGAFGITTAESAQLASPVPRLPQATAIAPEDFYVDLSAYGFSVEVPNAEFCERVYEALAENYGLTPEQLRWFSMHAALDAGHGDEFRKHARKVAETPHGLERLRDRTLQLSGVVKQVWDGYGKWR
jgi:pyrroloquinoline quinone (PQQ) biosynthesis protein C